ncbi:MAG TPA: hypothetical protein VF928_07435 [Usitatibacteraceae bacterium]
MFRNLSILAVALAVFCALVWATDTVTLQGERTIYTARCEQGSWQGELCTGNLVAAERYRYRVLKPHNEVFFWVVGSSEPSGKLTDCAIQDGRNWRCQPNADSARSITLEMAKGCPVPDSGGLTRSYHAVSKLTWVLLDNGIAITNTALSPPRPPNSGQAQTAGRRLAP